MHVQTRQIPFRRTSVGVELRQCRLQNTFESCSGTMELSVSDNNQVYLLITCSQESIFETTKTCITAISHCHCKTF